MGEQEMTSLEEALLCNFEEGITLPDNAPDYLQALWQGDWEVLLKKQLCEDVLAKLHDNDQLEEHLRNILNEEKSDDIFCIGIASLLSFVQANFTGPPLSESLSTFLTSKCNKDEDFKINLAVNNEEINVNVIHAELLYLAKRIFESCSLTNVNISLWWYLRYLMIHQSILDECFHTLFSKMKDTISKLSCWAITNVRLKAKLYTEMSQVMFRFSQIVESETYLNNAKELIKINYNLSGELGKRTKYQQTELAQLVCQVQLDDSVHRPAVVEAVVPDVIKLDDDVRLDSIEYSNKQTMPQLPIVEQTILLAIVQLMQRSRPKEKLTLEESESFLSVLLHQNNCWTVRFVSLLLRCQLECDHKRTIERSLSQCESLVECLNKEEPRNVFRVGTAWSASMPPKWKIGAQMADLMLNLGLVKGSLDVYLRLSQWEEVIMCYTLLQLRHKAAEIIRTQLSKEPTVKLWCLLGDTTDDVSCYEKAWELSLQKSSRVQRHWGQYFFSHNNYKESIPHFQKSLEINSLQNMVWIYLGYAALSVEDWKLAASAYRRYTSLEPGRFESWNNLAKAYIKLGEKKRSHFALQEALKYSFDNWKVWDNFMVVSADVGYFDDLIRAYHRILDIRERHLDLEVLFILTKAVITNVGNLEEAALKRLTTKTRELFGRLTSLYPNESQLWEMYSDLSPSTELKAQRLYRAYRGLVQGDWFKDPIRCGQVLELCHRLGEASLEAGNATACNARLTLKSVIAAVKKQDWEDNTEILSKVEDVLNKIINFLSNKQS